MSQSVHKLFADARAGAVFIYKPSGKFLAAYNGPGGMVTLAIRYLRLISVGHCVSATRIGAKTPNHGIVCEHADKSAAAALLCVPWWRKVRLSEFFIFSTTVELTGYRTLTIKPENHKRGWLLPRKSNRRITH